MSSSGRVEVVANAIAEYLRQNPAAADTADGIRSWWLPEYLRSVPLATVVEALDALEARGLVDQALHAGADVIYTVKAAACRRSH